MSGVFKRFKDLFITDDPTAKKKENVSPSTSTAPPKDAEQDSRMDSMEDTGTTGEVNRKFLELLFNALEENNLEGFDYLEYKKSLQYLKKMDMDEKTRYQSAFASARPMGATTKILLDSASFYLDILEKEHQQFNEAFQNQSKKRIEGNQQLKVDLENQMSSKKQQIEQLQQQIEQMSKQLIDVEEQIKTAASKVTKTKSDFVSSYDYLVRQIKTDITKIKSYLN